jgi:hypothetical protein
MPHASNQGPRPARLALFVGALFLVAGCASVTPIGELLDNSSKYNGKSVRIEGDVQGSAGALGKGAYQVKDRTGTLTVISEVGGPPRTGARVSVKGIFEAIATLGAQSLAVLREQSRSYP